MSGTARRRAPVALALVLLTSCSSGGSNSTPSSSPSSSVGGAIANAWKARAVDPKTIPLGDGHRSTTEAAVGSVFACGGGGGIGGANVIGPWIHGDTWDSTAKVAVQ